jgi:hypothetical protein
VPHFAVDRERLLKAIFMLLELDALARPATTPSADAA